MSHGFHAESVQNPRGLCGLVRTPRGSTWNMQTPHSPHGSVRNVWGSVNYCKWEAKLMATRDLGIQTAPVVGR